MSDMMEIELFTVIFLNISDNVLEDLDINSEIYIKKFYDMILMLKKNKCADTFTSIFDQYRTNDNIYYERQIQNLSNNLRKIFSASNDICFYIFLDNVKETIIDELLMIYYRCILFPHEKNILKRHAESRIMLKNIISPLLIIIDAIHHKYMTKKLVLKKSDIQSLFIDDTMMGYLVEIINNRSILMNIMYKIFLDTKCDKIPAKKIKGIKCAFFPFKVFSAELFILEHLLDFLK